MIDKKEIFPIGIQLGQNYLLLYMLYENRVK